MYMDIDLFPHLCFTCHLSVLCQSMSVCLSIYQSIIFTMTVLYKCLVKISVNVTNPFFFSITPFTDDGITLEINPNKRTFLNRVIF